MGEVSKINMKPAVFRSVALVFGILFGLSVSQLMANHEVADYLIPPVGNVPVEDQSACWLVRYLVVSVPRDDEYYIGKQRVELSGLGPAMTVTLKSIPADKRVLYIKSHANVRFGSLAKVIEVAKRADITRIEFVLDKRKRGLSHVL